MYEDNSQFVNASNVYLSDKQNKGKQNTSLCIYTMTLICSGKTKNEQLKLKSLDFCFTLFLQFYLHTSPHPTLLNTPPGGTQCLKPNTQEEFISFAVTVAVSPGFSPKLSLLLTYHTPPDHILFLQNSTPSSFPTCRFCTQVSLGLKPSHPQCDIFSYLTSKATLRGTWIAQLVKHQTLGFCLSQELRVVILGLSH